MSDINVLLKKIRGKDSLRAASKKTGISYTYWSILEKGVDPRTQSPIKPSPDTLKAVARGYKYPYEELMKAAGYTEGGDISYSGEFQKYELIIREIKDKYPGVDITDPDVRRKLMKAIDLVLDDYEQKE